jgi:hypothetical protein
MTIGSNQSLPLVVAAGALVFAGILSAAALVLDEEESVGNLRRNVALQFVQNEENSVQQRVYVVQYLDALGIHVLDCTLERDANRISVIPMLQRMAQYRWSHLYSINRHKRLTNAIARELKDQYDRYKRTHHN